MKRYIFICFILFFCVRLYATHQKAAEITFQHKEGYTYAITLITYTFTESLADRDELVVKWGDQSESLLKRNTDEIIMYPETQTKLSYYRGEHTFPGPGYYYISMEDNDRNGGVVNMPNSVSTPIYVETLLVISPFIDPPNNSPILLNKPIDKACIDNLFIHNAGAYDPDGDSLSYRLISCKGEAGEDVPGYFFPQSSKRFFLDSITGDLIWENPYLQGEYNVAFLIEEWRDGVKIGAVIRDMQIAVQSCDNRLPTIIAPDKLCVKEGDSLVFNVLAQDFDEGDKLDLSASSEVFSLSTEAAVFPSVKAKNPAQSWFRWKPAPSHIRKQAYPVYFRALDYGTPRLNNLKTTRIHVFPKAVEGLSAESEKTGILLSWEGQNYEQAFSYKVYRKQGKGGSYPYDSCRTGIRDSAYRLIVKLASSSTHFMDEDTNKKAGMLYCYQLVKEFEDGSESYVSQEACAIWNEASPIPVRIDIMETSSYNGMLALYWKAPEIIDSLDHWVYILKKGNAGQSIAVDTIAFLSPPLVYDSLTEKNYSVYYDVNLNTQENTPYYSLHLYEKKADSLAHFSSSSIVSSLSLRGVAHSKRLYLYWLYDHPWHNQYFIVYRKNEKTGNFDSVGKSEQPFFMDRNLENDKEYTYKVQAYGTYYNAQIGYPLRSLSNEITLTPKLLPPCTPKLEIQEVECKPLRTSLQWSFGEEQEIPNPEDCYQDIAYYQVFYKPYTQQEFNRPIHKTEDTYFVHESPPSYFGCYAIKAVNTSGEESAMSELKCADNRPCFYYKLPNVFTPNGDGINDVFKAEPNQYVEVFKISIFDRWGTLVFYSEDPDFRWNGKYKSTARDCPDGAYYYIADFSADGSRLEFNHSQTGSIILLR